jgi:hypothetical protein
VPPSPAFPRSPNPRANPDSVVTVDRARFTVLTPRLIRLEWSRDGRFEDRATLVFVNRHLPRPAFTTRTEGGWTVIDTGALRLRYRPDGRDFNFENLSIELGAGGRRVTWHPGMPDEGNLHGTTRTLDYVRGATALEPGLISRHGWVVVDDTHRPLLDDGAWPWVVPRPETESSDWYFLGYGHDYKAALGDYVNVAGRIPLPPRFAFGAWWSRHWAYTDRELMDLVSEFESHDVPLDVLVLDMDWHVTFGTRWEPDKKDRAGQRLGWTGYTWDRRLFPDPERFLAWCHGRGLRVTLNLHPASGVQPHEERYAAMARAMGIDPASGEHVPFEITDQRFAQHYFEILHHPLERQGVDFWWLDWQQEHETSVPGVNPTWWLNYLHAADMERRGIRPLIFHRWGGLGNHRHQVGFSGDTYSTWDSLGFQPFFTATAANVGYAYWSHDIGGHLPGPIAPELYTRWVQYGVFSPVLRTHTTKNPDAERRLWAYPADHAKAMRDAFLLRHALIPYIYTAARRTYDTGIAFIRPLYYEHPEREEAYEYTDQYMFGDDMMAAPITQAADETTGLVEKTVWVPPGAWNEWSSGAAVYGPVRIERRFALDQIPVYVAAGAIVPMQPRLRHGGARAMDPLVLAIFPGTRGETLVYEDEGVGLGYQHGACAWTRIEHHRAGNRVVVRVAPREGRYPGMPESRAYEIRLVAALPPARVLHDGRPLPWLDGAARDEAARGRPSAGWFVEGDTLTTRVLVPATNAAEAVEIVLEAPDGAVDVRVEGFAGALAGVNRAMRIVKQTWPRGAAPPVLIELAQAGRRIELQPDRAATGLDTFWGALPDVPREIRALDISKAEILRALAQL